MITITSEETKVSNIMFLTVREAAAGMYRLFQAIKRATRSTDEVFNALRKAAEERAKK